MNIKTTFPLFLGILLYVVPAAHAQPDEKETHAVLQAGQKLTETEVKELETNLGTRPADIQVRTKLLGYYWKTQWQSKASREMRQKHALWIIQNAPEGKVAGLPHASLDKISDGKAYEEGKTIWMKHTETHKNTPAVLGNAAAYFLIPEPEIAENLLNQASKLEPKNPVWYDKLGHLYALSSNETASTNGLLAFQTAQGLDDGKDSQFNRLQYLCKAALKAGEGEKASGYATQLLEQLPDRPKDWNSGNAVHHGNITLGHVALRNGDLKGAKEHLLKAGATTGSPQLDSFGPNMSLAKALLEKEEKDAVLQYFDLCRKFWKDEKLTNWTAEVKAGTVPDFGANVSY